jgi:hypothetical protein
MAAWCESPVLPTNIYGNNFFAEVQKITWGKTHDEQERQSAMAFDAYFDNFLVGLCLP